MRDRPQDHAVDLAGARENAVGKRRTEFFEGHEADVAELECKPEPEAAVGGFQDRDRRLGDLRPDPVARQNQELHGTLLMFVAGRRNILMLRRPKGLS